MTHSKCWLEQWILSERPFPTVELNRDLYVFKPWPEACLQVVHPWVHAILVNAISQDCMEYISLHLAHVHLDSAMN